MTPLIIPMQSLSSFIQSVSLDGNEYKLSFYWNTRGSAWFMDIADALGNAILSGVKLIISFPLLMQYNNPALPPGDFIVWDNNPNAMYVEAGRNDFTDDRNLQLIYMSVSS
jgi:hypothetical protein